MPLGPLLGVEMWYLTTKFARHTTSSFQPTPRDHSLRLTVLQTLLILTIDSKKTKRLLHFEMGWSPTWKYFLYSNFRSIFRRQRLHTGGEEEEKPLSSHYWAYLVQSTVLLWVS